MDNSLTELVIKVESIMNKIKPFIDNCETDEEGLQVLKALAVIVGTCPLMEDENIREGVINIIKHASNFEQ